MFTISIIIALILAALIIAQIVLATGFIARLRRPPAPPLTESECPKVALIICIRGKDLTLAECLTAALNQDYPDYSVYIIVDSQSDPAWPVVQKIVAANPQTPSMVQVLENPLSTCSLKCSSLIQAISGLNLSYTAIALLDSDVIPHRHWLKDLVAPLADPQIGATTGHRWFVPSPPSLINLARYAWNAAAVVLMYWLGMASGCSFAIRRSVIQQGRLLECWAEAYGEDTSINPALNELGLRLEIVPSAMLPERENCDLADFKVWVTRQLLSCRLHHRGWWGVVLHGLGTSVTLGLALLFLVAGVVGQRWEVIAPVAGALAAYFVTMMGLLAWLEATVAKAAAPRASAGTRIGWGTVWKLLPSILLAQLVYVVGLFRAASTRSVEWRGIRYQVNDSGGLRMMEYQASRAGEQRHPSRRRAGVAST